MSCRCGQHESLLGRMIILRAKLRDAEGEVDAVVPAVPAHLRKKLEEAVALMKEVREAIGQGEVNAHE